MDYISHVIDEIKKNWKLSQELTPLTMEYSTADEKRKIEIDKIIAEKTGKDNVKEDLGKYYAGSLFFWAFIIFMVAFNANVKSTDVEEWVWGGIFLTLILTNMLARFRFFILFIFSSIEGLLVIFFIGIFVFLFIAGFKSGASLVMLLIPLLLYVFVKCFTKTVKGVAHVTYSAASSVAKNTSKALGASEETADTIGKVVGTAAVVGVAVEAREFVKDAIDGSVLDSDAMIGEVDPNVVTSTPDVSQVAMGSEGTQGLEHVDSHYREGTYVNDYTRADGTQVDGHWRDGGPVKEHTRVQ